MTGKELRKTRIALGVTQKALAEAALWKQPFVVQVEGQAQVRPDTLDRYTAGLKIAALRVSEERAAQEKVDRAIIDRLSPAVTPPRVSETPPRPSSPVAVPSTGSPSTPVAAPEAKMSALEAWRLNQSHRPLSPAPTPPAYVSTPPPEFKLNSKPAPLAEPYSPSYTRAYSRLFAQSKGRTTVSGDSVRFEIIDIYSLAVTTVTLTRLGWTKNGPLGVESGDDFDRL